MRVLRSRIAMSISGRCFAVLAALLFAPSLIAQTLSLDNVPGIALSGSSSISAVSIDPATGNVVVRSSAGNLNSCTGPVAQVPTINSFTASTNAVLPGGSFSLSWSSSNTTSCTPSQGGGTNWPNFGQLGTSGSQSLTAPQSQGSITFQLTCTNGVSSDTRTLQVNVNQGGGGSCNPIYPNGSPQEFDQTFGLPWPAYNAKRRQFINNGQYFSVRFTASPSPTQFGSTTSSGFPQDGDGQGQASISTVSGCFDPAHLGNRCLSTIGAQFGVSWTNGTSDFACKLIPGQSYYVNVYFPDCASGNCGRDIGNIQQLQNVEQ